MRLLRVIPAAFWMCLAALFWVAILVVLLSGGCIAPHSGGDTAGVKIAASMPVDVRAAVRGELAASKQEISQHVSQEIESARDSLVKTITRTGLSGWEVAAIIGVANGLQILIGLRRRRK